MRKKKVAYVVHGLGKEGIATFLYNLICQINQDKYDVTIIMAVDQNGIPQDREEDVLAVSKGDIKILRTCDFHNVKYMIKHIHLLKEYFITYGPFDVVHSNMDSFNGINLYVARKMKIPIRISHSHKMSGREYNGFVKKTVVKVYRQLMRTMIAKNATTMLGCSAMANKYLHGNHKATVVLNGIDTERFINARVDISRYKEKMGFQKEKKIVCTVARIMPIKNPMFTVKVIKQLKKIRNDFVFVWVGSTETRDCIDGHDTVKDKMIEAIKEYGLNEEFVFMGKRDDVSEILHCAEVFLLPSLHEALPISAIEAQCAGCATILSNSITTEVDAGNAIYLPIDSEGAEKQWAYTISDIMDKGNKQMYTVVNVDKFDSQNMADRITDFYTQK